MRLGIDLDGVVSDFNKGWIDQYNADFGTAIPLDAVTTWGGITPLTHFTDMDAFWEWARDFGKGSVFRHLDTYPEAVPALGRLALEHEIVIITAKPDWAISDTLAWMADHRLPTREVHIVDLHAPKWPVPCDVYLDDAPQHIEAIHIQRPEASMCRYVRPWNTPRPGVHDVHDWKEFEDLIGVLENTRSSLRSASARDKE
jgi:5'(3')-deoxyribonucleotidase